MPWPDLLAHQDGVASRAQLLAAGLQAHDIRRLVRQRVLTGIHPGVYVDHTGEPTWLQRAWAAVLAVAPAALAGASALRAANGSGLRGFDETAPIEVAVERHRHVSAPRGVRLSRMVNLQHRVQWNTSPPRVRVEEAALDVAATARDDFDAIAGLSRVVTARMTTADRLVSAARARRRLPRRRFLMSVLGDLGSGATSALEHAYLVRVERAHGLPTGRRQVAAEAAGRIYRDVEYAEHALVVELDGRLDHLDARARDADLERDLAGLADGLVTVRLGWGQVVRRQCATAARVHRLLSLRGPTPPLGECPQCGGSRSPGDVDPPR